MNSIVDDDREQSQISRNTAYFPPAFPRPIYCAYNYSYASATSDSYYGVLLLGKSKVVVGRKLIPNALHDGVAVAGVFATGGVFD